MLPAILNKSWQQHPTRHQLYGHLPPITKTIQVRRTRHVGHCWRSRDELISDVLLWTPTYSREKAGRPARTYILQLSEDTGCSPEDLPDAMNDREKWWERVRDTHASGMMMILYIYYTHTHTHTYIYIYIHIYIYIYIYICTNSDLSSEGVEYDDCSSAKDKILRSNECLGEYNYTRGRLRCVDANMLDCEIVGSEFKLQSSNYVHVRTNSLQKVMNPFIPPAIGSIVSLLSFYKDGFGIK